MNYIFYTSLFLLIFLFSLSLEIFPQNNELKFEVLSTEDGLPGNWVEAILQDSQGFMWFGTDQGLCRYDGYEFRNFSGNPIDTNSIGNNLIWSIIEDREECFWIGVNNGLYKLDYDSGKLTRFGTEFDLYLGWFRLLNADSLLWIADSRGVVKFNKQTGVFKRYVNE